LTGEVIRRDEDGEWKSEEVLKQVTGVLKIEKYIERRRETIMKYAKRGIYI
jgi:hypothetical protein